MVFQGVSETFRIFMVFQGVSETFEGFARCFREFQGFSGSFSEFQRVSWTIEGPDCVKAFSRNGRIRWPE